VPSGPYNAIELGLIAQNRARALTKGARRHAMVCRRCHISVSLLTHDIGAPQQYFRYDSEVLSFLD